MVILRIDYFIRIIVVLKVKGIKVEILGLCIMYYVEKWLLSMDGEVKGLIGYWYGRNELYFSVISGRN